VISAPTSVGWVIGPVDQGQKKGKILGGVDERNGTQTPVKRRSVLRLRRTTNWEKAVTSHRGSGEKKPAACSPEEGGEREGPLSRNGSSGQREGNWKEGGGGVGGEKEVRTSAPRD